MNISFKSLGVCLIFLLFFSCAILMTVCVRVSFALLIIGIASLFLFHFTRHESISTACTIVFSSLFQCVVASLDV